MRATRAQSFVRIKLAIPDKQWHRGDGGVCGSLPKFAMTHVTSLPTIRNQTAPSKNTNKSPKIQVGTYLNVPRQVFANSGLPLTVLLPVKKGIIAITINFLSSLPALTPRVSPVIISLERGHLR